MRRHKGTKIKHKTATIHPSKHQSFKGIDNTRELDAFLGRTKIFQDVLGITSEELTSLYEAAQAFLQANRFEEAKASFLFLTKINPFASDFWVGLGISHLTLDELPQAFDAFIMALTMEPSRYESYALAIETCIQMKNFQQAEALLKQAITYAKRHPANDQSSIILQEAPRIQFLIDQEMGK